MNKKYSFDKFIRCISLLTFSLAFSFSLFSQECPEINARQYADIQSYGVVGLGTVTNSNQAIDEDLSTYSSIVVVAGSVHQNFSWSSGVVDPGTPVSVKMGPEIGLLALASNITIQARNAGSNVGDAVLVDGSLLSLLSGENTYEYTFVPASGATPVAYDEIRVTVFSIGLGYTANVYEVYTHYQTDMLAECNEADIVDLLYGVENLGLEVLNVTVGVANPWNSVDEDPDTYAVMYNNVGLLSRAQLTAIFSSPNKEGDLVTVHLSNPGQLLSVGLLNGFSLQLYNGPNAVGPEMDLSNSLLSLNLLNAGDEALLEISTVAGMEFDRIKFSLGGVASVLDGVRIHEISRYSAVQVSNAVAGHLFLYPDDPIVLEEIDECTTYQIYDELGNLLDTSDGLTFSLPGGVQEGYTYSFYIQGYRYGCPFGYGKELLVTIYGDTQIPPGECPDINERVYADNQTWFTTGIGTVVNPEQAVDGDPLTHSTIVNPIVVAGIGTTVQTLNWDETIPAGTPVSVKLGPENGLLGLVSGVSVVAMHEGAIVSNPYWIDGNLLSLIGAENTYEYSFVPSLNGIPQNYDAVRIIAGGLLELATAFNVYEAYYHVPVDEIADCGDTEVLDLFYGAQDLGLEVLTATVGVLNPWEAVDGDEDTYALMYNGAAVLAKAELTVVYKAPSKEGDKIQITISEPGTILTLGLLEGFSIQRYYGNMPVGYPLTFEAGLLELILLDPGDNYGTIIADPEDALTYDRIKISMGGVANVIDGLRIHEIVRIPPVDVENAEDNLLTLCAKDPIVINPIDDCSYYEIYDEDGNLLITEDGFIFELPDYVEEGETYIFYIQTYRYGCPFGIETELEVTILPSATQADIGELLVNGTDGSETLCILPEEEIILTASLSPDSTILNPVFVWYDENGEWIEENSTGILNLGVLLPGIYTYSVGVYGDGVCESNADERKEITFEIKLYADAGDIEVNDDEICFNQTAELIPTAPAVINPQFKWYLTNDYTTPINDGDIIDGVTFGVSVEGILTVSGLEAGTVVTYYVTVSGDNYCENEAGNFAEAQVTVFDVDSPTTENTDQEFCAIDNPTVADIQVNEPGVIWYDAPIDGTPYDPSDPLIDGNTYYGTLLEGDCESTERLAVTVHIIDPGTPTTDATDQDFCAIDNPTVADIQVNEPGVIWYDAPVDGTPYDPTDPLIDGNTYYGTLLDGDCESTERLAVTVHIIDPGTPTTDATDQDFCAIDNPTVADIQVNEPGVIWYDAPVDGTPYDPTDPLIDGNTYYGTLLEGDCESTERLAVTVHLTDPGTPTTDDTDQDFCAIDNPTVADIQVNEPGVIWYDAPIDGTPYDPTDPLIDGNTYYGILLDGDCESTERLAVTVHIIDPGTPTTDATDQDFCAIDNPTVADIQVNEPGVIWYDAPIDGTPYDPTDPLIDGNTYYGTLLDGDCESTERLAVTVHIIDPGTPTTDDTNQEFCAIDNPTVADIQANEPGVIWYDAPVDGTPYDPSDPLIDGNTYYGTLLEGDCESTERLAVTVHIIDPGTPTTDATDQEFCAIDNPTVADIQVNEPGVIWYDAPVDGTPYDPTDPLIDGNTYYGTLLDGDCESTERLAVTVHIIDPGTPTTDATDQDFCAIDNPTVADIQVNEPGVIWYDAPVDGTPYDPTDPLIDGNTYYGTLLEGDCESTERLAVTVHIIDPGTPTTDATDQDFCAIDNPTVADIQVNEPGVIWYDAPVDGTPYDPSDPLIDGNTYYGTLLDGDCESTERLAVTVHLIDPGTPTTDATDQEFCAIDNPTVADIQVNEPGVIWYDAPVDGTPYDPTDPLIDGNTYYGTLLDGDCESTLRLAVTVHLYEGSDATIEPDVSDEICLNTVVTYTTESGQSNYLWTVVGGDIIYGGTTADNFVEVLWTSIDETYVSVSYDGVGCYTGEEVTYIEKVEICADISITKEVDNLEPMVGDHIQFTITLHNSGPNHFENVVVSEQIPSGFSFVSYQASSGVYSPVTGEWSIDLLEAYATETLLITVEVLGSGDYTNIAEIISSFPEDIDEENNIDEVTVTPICLFVYNEFSPNGDGINEVLYITCIETFPENELKVFNKYGKLVYQTRNYDNTWKGVDNVNSSSGGDILPSDTYYYVLEVRKDGQHYVNKGWLFIIK